MKIASPKISESEKSVNHKNKYCSLELNSIDQIKGENLRTLKNGYSILVNISRYIIVRVEDKH